ncbi:MAG: 1-(5-phosphoribosyl)-5-[(5-phosphoribosylamino)methylideneamino]imidazole-4-carboxamide isomerase [Deltaproteobacteria bacterium]|nr:1-(5-phosphoribosyl)-5-[(5-phosphoribosylamino)methylideneamino]imidazole-4-carboxamide isomerase [Deltaproteobacteria bacterium]
MIIIPAVDIKNGQCVRLAQGDFTRVTVYAENPADMARLWAQKGAQRIHLVDLDGSVAGKPQNGPAILEIARSVTVPVEVGGGIRTMETIDYYLENGVASVILGTAAIQDEDFVKTAARRHAGKIILGIDALGGRVAVRGWTEQTAQQAVALARRYENCGIQAIVYTDIQRDGMETGVNVEQTRALAKSVSIPVIASGGVASLADIDALVAVRDCSFFGVIVGRALYTGAIALEDAVAKTRQIPSQQEEKR